jgi:CRISPR-associated protein Cas1
MSSNVLPKNVAPADRAAPHRARRRSVEVPDYLPARMLNEFVYCPRLFFYEWVEGVFAHSADTIEGALRHEKLERKADALPAAADMPAQQIHARSVELASETRKLIARIDLVDAAGGEASPVDYKRGAPRDGDDGPEAWPADRAQVCAQALILRDNGYACREAIVYYTTTKQRVRVAVDDTLVQETLRALADARVLATAGRAPPPLVDSPKCPRCSLVSICLPDETAVSMSLPAGPAAQQLALFPADVERTEPASAITSRPADEIRRLDMDGGVRFYPRLISRGPIEARYARVFFAPRRSR